jgi:hypothetical protein
LEEADNASALNNISFLRVDKFPSAAEQAQPGSPISQLAPLVLLSDLKSDLRILRTFVNLDALMFVLDILA